MRIYSVVSVAITGVFLASGSVVALANSPSVMMYEGVPSANCAGNIGPAMGIRQAPRVNCSANVVRHAGSGDPLAPVNAYNSVPYGHLKTFTYKNTPDVNVMRVHSRAPLVGLNDVPTGFTNGCAPASTRYCRSSGAALPGFAPVFARAPLPIMRPPATPVYKMRPPVPMSIQHNLRPVSVMPAPQGGTVLGYVSGGTYTYQPPGGGRYWEKVSGPTTVGGLKATQILCRREAPKPTPVTVNVVRPVIGVPHAVPTPLAVPVRPLCGAAPAPLAGRAMGPRRQAPVLAGGRWTY